MTWRLLRGDSRILLRTLPDASVDAVVTDPPAGIEFADWASPGRFGATFQQFGYSDGRQRIAAPSQRLSLRNPNCRKCHKHIRGANGCRCEKPDPDESVQQPRIQQRTTFVAFLQEVFGECLRVLRPGGHILAWSLPRTSHWTATALEDSGFEIRDCVYHVFGQGLPKSLDVGRAVRARTGAEEWSGWGTALKPAVECWWLCRKPVEAQSVAAQVSRTGTGALNIDACRVGAVGSEQSGRWPSHLLLTHAPGCTDRSCVLGCPILGMEDQSPGSTMFFMPFWYAPKASSSERESGSSFGQSGESRGNTHPTVKSVALMRYLVRLVTPKGGVVLDPFAGSGTTLCAAIGEGMDCIGIEREEEYACIAESRARASQSRRDDLDSQHDTFDMLMED